MNVSIDHVKSITANIQSSVAQFSALMERLSEMENKQSEKYTRLFSESHQHTGAKHNIPQATNVANRKRKERKKFKHQKQFKIHTEANKKDIKNLSNKELLDDQINGKRAQIHSYTRDKSHTNKAATFA